MASLTLDKFAPNEFILFAAVSAPIFSKSASRMRRISLIMLSRYLYSRNHGVVMISQHSLPYNLARLHASKRFQMYWSFLLFHMLFLIHVYRAFIT